jgi:hypothetical protein
MSLFPPPWAAHCIKLWCRASSGLSGLGNRGFDDACRRQIGPMTTHRDYGFG